MWVNPSLPAIDEISELVCGDLNRALFVRLLDKRYAACRPTLLVGNLGRDEYESVVGSSIASRTSEGGGGVEFRDWPSFRANRDMHGGLQVVGSIADRDAGSPF